jgi:hypothetical protein
MNKKLFLFSLAAALSSLSQNASAASSPSVEPLAPDQSHRAFAAESALPGLNESKEVLTTNKGELFKFVITRAGDGQLMAQHMSHQSHASHASHASHSSHYSGR